MLDFSIPAFDLVGDLDAVLAASRSKSRVSGYTHSFYTYPARFSPQFARAAIETFSAPGDLVADPFMGGGTTLVEARALSRLSVGTDISELAEFVSRTKTSILSHKESRAVRASLPELYSCLDSPDLPSTSPPPQRNLDSVEAKLLVAQIVRALGWATSMPTRKLERFARCAVLKAGQLVMNGKRFLPEPAVFDADIDRVIKKMLEVTTEYRRTVLAADSFCPARGEKRTLTINSPADALAGYILKSNRPPPSLVLTSPPYPGVHILYHRWQLNGGKETSLPFYIADRRDGEGLSHYCMHARKQDGGTRYFSLIKETFQSLRDCLVPSSTVVQLVAFPDPERQLPSYLRTMREAGYQEYLSASVLLHKTTEMKRTVPNRKWYTNIPGVTKSNSSKEFILVHRPV